MRRDFFLENGIYCEGEYNDFKLYYQQQELTKSCSNIAYIPKKLIAIKCEKKVYVYFPEVIKRNDKLLLHEIAEFESKSLNAYLKVKIQDKTYIIDSNVQITLCSCITSY